jgi:hypothetical protein
MQQFGGLFIISWGCGGEGRGWVLVLKEQMPYFGGGKFLL